MFNELSKAQEMKRTLIVYKGMPTEEVVDLDELVRHRRRRVAEIFDAEQPIISYEEFLYLQTEFLINIDEDEVFDEIIILENKLFMEYYPLTAKMSDKTLKDLLTHFEDREYNDKEDEPEIGELKIAEVYSDVKEVNGKIYVAYYDEDIEQADTVQVRPAFYDVDCKELEKTSESADINIVTELDYIELVQKILDGEKNFVVKITSYTCDKARLEKHLGYLNDLSGGGITICSNAGSNTFVSKPEYTDILKKHWGYNSFRTFPVYDLDELEKGNKKVIQVSQEQVISDIVEGVELCQKGKIPRDVFVTASTGAGKSLMFQIPAIHIAEKYKLVTLVISPLIGLMNDQIDSLENRNYKYAKTINSDISPLLKKEVLEKMASGELHVLYLSPESLMAKANIEDLIGDRVIGQVVIDEAHITTTWGKQFRPDYWYLGDALAKIRKKQIEKCGQSFVISSFTATSIYGGKEDMCSEIKANLNMMDPITYLGYVKRDDINISITEAQKKPGRNEYEMEKFEVIAELVKRANTTGKKTLVYFPMVTLINRCYDYLDCIHLTDNVAMYYGPMDKERKAEAFEAFKSGKKNIMFATKAFGMGIDIDDIEIVAHFAPTGNVCDYVQEIGRAARNPKLNGEACYSYNKGDFKHVNRLHGMSSIRKGQLVEVIRKIKDLYYLKRATNKGKRNGMLIDAENFAYIFQGSSKENRDDLINKVKTALLIIQKDFESKKGFSPVMVKPVPVFAYGFFKMSKSTYSRLLAKYPGCVQVRNAANKIYRVNLKRIWETDYEQMSFPQFKYMLYKKDPELEFNKFFVVNQAFEVTVEMKARGDGVFERTIDVLSEFVKNHISTRTYVKKEDFVDVLMKSMNLSRHKAEVIAEVFISGLERYREIYRLNGSTLFNPQYTVDGTPSYKFNAAATNYFSWMKKVFKEVRDAIEDDKLYITDGRRQKEFEVFFGIMEAMGVLEFEIMGGSNSQIYIHVNQVAALIKIVEAPQKYSNRLLNTVKERHIISVAMLTYIFEGKFSSAQIWELIEDYFLGIIPDPVKDAVKKDYPNIVF